MLQPFVRTPVLGCEGETVLVDVDVDGRRAHVIPSYTTSHVAELYAKKVEVARTFGAATTEPKSMTRGMLRRGNPRGRRNPGLDPQVLPLLLNSTSVEFAPVPYFLENPSYLFEDHQKQLFVLTLTAAGLGKVPARWHVLSLAEAHAIQVFTDWLLERVKASYVEPFLSLRISDVGPLLPTENGTLFLYMPPAGDDPDVQWKGLRLCHRLKLAHLAYYTEISKSIVSGMGRPTSLAPFKSLAKTERASYAYAFTRAAEPVMLDSPFLPSTGFARVQKNFDERGLCILFYRGHDKTWLTYCSRESDAEPFGKWIEKKIAPLTMERLLKL